MKTLIIFFASILLFITGFSLADTPIPAGDVSGTWTKQIHLTPSAQVICGVSIK